jgi:hypothetical protein
MLKKYRTWIPGIIFWTLFLVSIGLQRRYRWLDLVWNTTWMGFLILVAVWGVVDIFRNRHTTNGYIGYRGVPRWVVRLFGDDSD